MLNDIIPDYSRPRTHLEIREKSGKKFFMKKSGKFIKKSKLGKSHGKMKMFCKCLR